MLFKNARKTQNLRILQGKLNQNVIFCVQIFFKIVLFLKKLFFKIVLFKNNLFFKIVLFKKIFLQNRAFQKVFLIQNLTRCKNFNSKSDAF